MSSKTTQIVKKKTIKELNTYTEALENRINVLEKIIKSLKIDPKIIAETLKCEVENSKKISKVEKRINILDKKVKTAENGISKNEENSIKKCQKCGKELANSLKMKEHNLEKHPIEIKCRYCPEIFKQSWRLEMHIKTHVEKRFKCDECDQEFHLKWRLMKHKEGHNSMSRFCHFFNNFNDCPYVELGCMFKHLQAPSCKFNQYCNRKLCQFRHDNDVSVYCEVKKSSETSFNKHLPSNHETMAHKYAQYDQTFHLKDLLDNHIVLDHDQSKEQNRRFPCEKCFYEFDSEENFNLHLSGIEHNIIKKDDNDYVDSDDEDDEDYSDNCRLCSQHMIPLIITRMLIFVVNPAMYVFTTSSNGKTMKVVTNNIFINVCL